MPFQLLILTYFCNPGRALQYQAVIDSFVATNCKLREFELDDHEWEATTLMTDQLQLRC